MCINQIITSIDNTSGGPARSVTNLLEALITESSYKYILQTLESPNPLIKDFSKSNCQIVFNKSIGFTYSRQLEESIKKGSVSLFHGHGLWEMPVHQMAKIARIRQIPYIITPRGMLSPLSLKQSKIKKQLAMALFQKKDLENASCLHATSKDEVDYFRDFGLKNPIALIPNGVVINDDAKIKKKKEFNSLLFFSRIVKNKGIEELLAAWSMIDSKLKRKWILQIVGNGDCKYVNSLKRRAIEYEMTNVLFRPSVYKLTYKEELINDSSLLVLPSYSESFGMVIAESLGSGTPVITTKNTPWEDLKTHNCGWWIDIGVKPLKEALETALQTSESELVEMGQNGRKLIEKKYNVDLVAKQMIELYNWILKKGSKPDFVSLD